MSPSSIRRQRKRIHKCANCGHIVQKTELLRREKRDYCSEDCYWNFYAGAHRIYAN